MHKFILFIVTIFLISCNGESNEQSTSNESSATPVAGFEVTKQDLSRTVSASGAVRALNIQQIGAPFSGIINSVFVEEGDYVNEGDILATFNLHEIQAELRRAEAQLREVEQRLNRSRALLVREAISRSEFEDLEAERNVSAAEKEIWETRSNLGEIKASQPGIITERTIEPGSPVSANERLFQIENLSRLVIRVGVSELDVIHINPEDSVTVRFDAFPNQAMSAKVRRVFPAAETSSRRFLVEVELEDNSDVTVRPGFMARVRFDVDQRSEVIAVPSEALLASQRGEDFLYKIENDSLTRVDVETGVSRRNMTQILNGLSVGDVVVGTNPTNLSEGNRVRITEWIE